MEECQKKAFDFASESTRLLITLSTGIIALTITFSKDIIGDISTISIWPMVTSWVLYILSILFGIFTMQSLTGALHPMSLDKGNKIGMPPYEEQIDEVSAEAYAARLRHHQKTVSINRDSIIAKSLAQILLFFAALIFTCVFGYMSLDQKANRLAKEKMERSDKVSERPALTK